MLRKFKFLVTAFYEWRNVVSPKNQSKSKLFIYFQTEVQEKLCLSYSEIWYKWQAKYPDFKLKYTLVENL
jgi:hypothetical protein